jgi:ornithine--oxo-acid transaminase
VLFVLDEIQTGLGRTGRMFAHEHEPGAAPDMLVLGKALGGGAYPVSAVLASREIMTLLRPGDHGSTFGGNPLACAVAVAALDVLERDDLCARSATLGAWLLSELRSIKSPLVTDVRGRGMFIGIEIDPAKARAREVCERLMPHGILSKETHETVVRLAPPLVITREQIDWAVERIELVLKEMSKIRATG